MAVTFKDYYAILGVDRNADAAAIKKAYRRKARELHPDRNKAKGAEQQFQDVNEANEVLSDPEKRARYDQLGANWQNGAPFDFSEYARQGGGPFAGGSGGGFNINVDDIGDLNDLFGRGAGGGGGGFSDFFEQLFGGMGGGAGARGGRRRGHAGPRAGGDTEAEVELTLADLVNPTPRRITLGIPLPDGTVQRKTVNVNIPAGLRPGQRLRLAGQGAPGQGGGVAGDIYLKIRVRPEPHLAIDGDDIITSVDVPAPVAVVGGTARVPSPEGPVTLRVAAGTQQGRVMRVRGRGLPRKDGTRGDLLARVSVVVPEHPGERERELYQELANLIDKS